MKRITTFFNKKTAEMLPFVKVNAIQLASFFLKNTCMKEIIKNSKNCESRLLGKKADFLSTQMDLQTKVSDTQNQLSKELGRYQRAKQCKMLLTRIRKKVEEEFYSCLKRNSNLESENS